MKFRQGYYPPSTLRAYLQMAFCGACGGAMSAVVHWLLTR